MSDKKFIVGAIYRNHLITASDEKKSGVHMDILCDSQSGAGTIVGLHPSKLDKFRYTDGDFRIGAKTSLIALSTAIVADNMEAYDAELPVKIVEKIKEVIITKEVPVRTEAYHDSWIDSLYNWYCRNRDRLYDDLV